MLKQKIEKKISAGESIDKITCYSFTYGEQPALFAIAQEGDLETFEYFLQQNPRLDIVNDAGKSAVVVCLESYQESISFGNASLSSGSSSSYLANELNKIDATKLEEATFFQLLGDPLFLDLAKSKFASMPIFLSETSKIEYRPIFHLRIAKRLIELGVNSDLPKALVLAAKCCDVELVKFILKKLTESNQDLTVALGKALQHAVTNDNLPLCQLLLQHDAQSIPDECGQYPLHVAKSAAVVQLLANEKTINQANAETKLEAWKKQEGNTPLHAAVLAQKLDVIRELMRLSADKNRSNQQGETILHVAKSNIALLKLLIDEYQCQFLINVPDGNGNAVLLNLLRETISISDINPLIDYLIAQGADVTLVNKEQETVLHLFGSTLLNISQSTYQNILSRSRSVLNQQDKKGRTAAHIAASKLLHLNWFKQLLDAEIDLNLQDENGDTVLLTLLQALIWRIDRVEAYTPIILKLINATIDINLQNKKGNTYLHYLAQLGYVEGIQAAVAKGATIDILNASQQTPLFYALAAGQIHAVDDLIQIGANQLLIEQATVAKDDGSQAAIDTHAAKTQYRLLFPQTDADKQFAIDVAFRMLQYTRWSLRDEERSSKYPAYRDSIRHLINQYGKTNFIAKVKTIFDMHRNSLDIRNTIEFGAHTDMSPIAKPYMLSAAHILANHYELHMQGHGHLVNVKTLFGDADFWLIIRDEDKEIYQTLIAHIKQWPTVMTFNAIYCSGSHKPLELFQHYFPEAFDIIKHDLGIEKGLSTQHQTPAFYRIINQNNGYKPLTFNAPESQQSQTPPESLAIEQLEIQEPGKTKKEFLIL